MSFILQRLIDPEWDLVGPQCHPYRKRNLVRQNIDHERANFAFIHGNGTLLLSYKAIKNVFPSFTCNCL